MLERADHMVLGPSAWLGTPAGAHPMAFLEHLARNDFLLVKTEVKACGPAKRMRGKSVRIVMTMGMPSLVLPDLLPGPFLKALEAGVFQMAGSARCATKTAVLAASISPRKGPPAHGWQKCARWGRAGK